MSVPGAEEFGQDAEMASQLPQAAMGSQAAQAAQAASAPGGASPGGATHAEQQLVMILASLQQNQQAILQMMRDQSDQRAHAQSSLESLRGKDLSKVLNAPSPFEAKTRDEELARWANWSWGLESWIITLDHGFAAGIDLIKAQGSNEIKMSSLSLKDQERSQLMFGILSGLLHERGKRLLRSIADRNGYEAYRSLLVDLLPGSRSRMLALLQMINQWPSFDHKQGYSQQMMKLEAAFNEYDSQSSTPLSEDIKIACLLRCVTGQLKQHLNVAVTEKTKYADLRSLVLRWDNAQTRWDTAVAATYSLGDGRGAAGFQPMDVDAIGALSYKGKDKGKGPKGKNKGKDYNKGKGKDSKGKHQQYPKGKDQGKGWNNQQQNKGKNKGKGNVKNDSEVCLYCGKRGHWKRDCYKYKSDMAKGIKQVASGDDATTVNDSASVAASASTVAPSHSVSNAQAPRRIQMISRFDRSDLDLTDLTEIDDYADADAESAEECVLGFGGVLRAVQAAGCLHASAEYFDLAVDDDESGPSSEAWGIILEYSAFDLDSECLCAICARKDDAFDDSKAGSADEALPISVQESSSARVIPMSVHESSSAHVIPMSVHESSSAHVIPTSVRESPSADEIPVSVHESLHSAHVISSTMSVHEGSAQSVGDSVADTAVPVNSNNRAHVIPMSVQSSSADVIPMSVQSSSAHEIPLSVRAVSKAPKTLDIILDSGADCSALPMCFGHVGVEDCEAMKGSYVDAQGNPLRTAGVRVAEVQVGDLRFRERFVISDVTMPLLSLGKLYRAGWYVLPDDGGLKLTNGRQGEAVRFKKQSLCVRGNIRIVQNQEIRAVTGVSLGNALSSLPVGTWSRLGHRLFVLKSYSKRFVDTTLIPLSELLWKRSTLVCRGGVWSLVEFNEDISSLDDRTVLFEDSESIEQVITFAHSRGDLSPEEMFFEVPEVSPSAQIEAQQSAEPEPVAPASENPEHSELPVDQRDEVLPPESIEIDGVIVDGSSSLETMRNACKALGLPENGNKAQIFKRLGKHCIEHELLQSKHVSHTLQSEFERDPHGQSVTEEPSAHEVKQHQLTHEPYKPWCKVCVAHRARQDQHASVADHEGSSASVISIDFGFLSRTESDRNKLTVLFAHDRHSKAVCAIPTPRKGGQAALSHMTTELSRFILWLGYPSIRLRSDNENSVVAVVDSVRKVVRSQGVEVLKDSVAIDAHQANGPVEQALQSVRQLACTLMSQLEAGLGGEPDKVLFDTDHPMWQWAVVHAAWIRTRFSVTQGCTPYERLTNTLYRGKVCMFGEAVMAYLKQSVKATAKWQKAIWLGKTTANDVNILGVSGGIFVSRSVRRFSDCWDGKLAAEIDTCVWQHGLASLGGTLVLNNKKASLPAQPALPLPVEAGKPDDEAPRSPSQVAGSDPESSSGSQMSVDFPDGVPDLEQIAAEAASTQQSDVVDVLLPAIPEAVQLSENPRPQKQPRLETSTISMISTAGEKSSGANLIVGCEEMPCTTEIRKVTYTHEDESVELAFDQDAIDDMEDYDYEEYNDDQIGDAGDLDQRLCRPRDSDVEPECGEEEMRVLDSIADQVEITRLKSMSVLQDPASMDLSQAVHLTTKMVRTWRQKETGNPPVPVWYRRSRYVAREYAWLSERTDLFSPAGSSLCNRLLPILFMYSKSKDDNDNISDDDKLSLFAVDIGDAFLTVRQVRPTYVTYVHPDGSKELFYLGFVLPGQRSGSSDWYDDFMKFLGTNLDIVECPAHPSLVKTADQSSRFAMQLHVDDMLGFAKRKFVHETFLPTLKKKYKVTAQLIENVGDFVTFLKRKHLLMSESELLLTPSPKHFDKLFALLRLDERASPKKTPYMPQLDEIDESHELQSEEASIYRSGIGLLLYLAVDLPECQCAIRALASRMAKPTQVAMLGLRHLAKYLISARHNGVMIVKTDPGEGLLGPRNDAGDQSIVLESFSDSNWASRKGTRRSVSASVLSVAGNLLFSSSRTQRVVALSSGEAELLSAASSLCDGIMIRELLDFLGYGRVKIFHHLDASAAKAILERSGVGKVRHLSCRVLWCQQLVKQNEVALLKISTTFNPSDLMTKSLSRARTFMLMCLLRVWDDMNNYFVGTHELREEREKQTFKQSMHVLRNIRVPIMISKSALRAMVMSSMISIGSALSFGSGMDTFATVYALMFIEFPLMTLMILYLFTVAVIGTIMCMRSQPTVVIKSFDKPLRDEKMKDPIDVASRSSSKSSSGSVTGEEVMIKQRRKRSTAKIEHPVWIASEFGKKYHMIGCGKLNQSLEVTELEESSAIAKGLKPCSFCNPHRVYHGDDKTK